MALDNLISIEFNEEEKTAITTAFEQISKVLVNKVVNLTPEERQRYGRINDRTQNWIEKVDTYMVQKPQLIPFYLNKEEFDKDRTARAELKDIIKISKSLLESLEDTNMLLSTDVYQSALAFYHNVRLASEQNVAGTTTIYQDLAKQFSGRPKSVEAKVEEVE